MSSLGRSRQSRTLTTRSRPPGSNLVVEAGYAEFRNERRPKADARLKPSVMLAFLAELRLS